MIQDAVATDYAMIALPGSTIFPASTHKTKDLAALCARRIAEFSRAGLQDMTFLAQGGVGRGRQERGPDRAHIVRQRGRHDLGPPLILAKHPPVNQTDNRLGLPLSALKGMRYLLTPPAGQPAV